MQRMLLPSGSVPEFIVPIEHEKKLQFSFPETRPSVLPTMYFGFTSPLRLELAPAYKLFPLSLQSKNLSAVYVRRFKGQEGMWGPWMRGHLADETASHRIIGPVYSFAVHYHESEDERPSFGSFIPYLGEICEDPETADFISAEEYLQRKRSLNLVYIPIPTRWPDGTPEEPSERAVYYVGEVLWVNEDWTQFHVHVLNGAWSGLSLLATHVCSFNLDSEEAVETFNHDHGNNVCWIHDKVAVAITHGLLVDLNMAPPQALVCPPGHNWGAYDNFAQTIDAEEQQGDENGRVFLLRRSYFDKLAFEDWCKGKIPDWYDGSSCFFPITTEARL